MSLCLGGNNFANFAWYQNFIFPVFQGKTTYSYKLKTYRKAVFSFPCIVPIALNKRIFYNFKALNGNTFPFYIVSLFLNPQFPLPERTISPYQVDNFPIQRSTCPSPKYYRSSAQVPLVPRQKWTRLKAPCQSKIWLEPNLPNPPSYGSKIYIIC